MRSMVRVAAALALVLLFPVAASAGSHRLGFGYHYWKTMEDVDISNLGDVDDNGAAAVISYQYSSSALMRFEFDFEYFDEGFGGSTETAYSPQAFLLIGRLFYAGVGVGMTKSDSFPNGESWSDPWFAGRIGVDMLLLPRIHLDLNANYRAGAFRDLQDAEYDAMTFGASLRFAL